MFKHSSICGLEVTILPADNKHPDCIFVEDQAIVIDGHVLLPVPGHPSRVAEQPPIADFLSRQLNGFQVCGMFGDARMDGGDILRLGDIFFVGRSERTNELELKHFETSSRTLVTNCELSIFQQRKPSTSPQFPQHQPITSSSQPRVTLHQKTLVNFQKAVKSSSCLKKRSTVATRLVSKTGKSSLQKAIRPFSKHSRRKVWIQSFSTWARFVRLMVQLRAVPSSSNLKQRVDIRECGRSVCCRGRPAWSKALG